MHFTDWKVVSLIIRIKRYSSESNHTYSNANMFLFRKSEADNRYTTGSSWECNNICYVLFPYHKQKSERVSSKQRGIADSGLWSCIYYFYDVNRDCLWSQTYSFAMES